MGALGNTNYSAGGLRSTFTVPWPFLAPFPQLLGSDTPASRPLKNKIPISLSHQPEQLKMQELKWILVDVIGMHCKVEPHASSASELEQHWAQVWVIWRNPISQELGPVTSCTEHTAFTHFF